MAVDDTKGIQAGIRRERGCESIFLIAPGEQSNDDDGGIPKSILDESNELAGATDAKDYEADLQRAMLMSMGIGGGSIMGVGDYKNRSSSKSMHGSSPISTSGMEEEQLAMATTMSLSEQEVRQSKRICPDVTIPLSANTTAETAARTLVIIP